jgi:hypothetical protein
MVEAQQDSSSSGDANAQAVSTQALSRRVVFSSSATPRVVHRRAAEDDPILSQDAEGTLAPPLRVRKATGYEQQRTEAALSHRVRGLGVPSLRLPFERINDPQIPLTRLKFRHAKAILLIGPTLQLLYDSEIDFSIDARTESGFDWKLASPTQRSHHVTGNTATVAEAVLQKAETSIHLFPSSKFSIASGKGGVQ